MDYRTEYNKFSQWWFSEGRTLAEKHEDDRTETFDAMHAVAWHAWIASKEEGE